MSELSWAPNGGAGGDAYGGDSSSYAPDGHSGTVDEGRDAGSSGVAAGNNSAGVAGGTNAGTADREGNAEGLNGPSSPSGLSSSSVVVRLRGLPWQAGDAEIIDFFRELEIARDGIVITTNAAGRPTGEAFVRFTNASDADKAVLRHKQSMGHRYVEVFRGTNEEMESAEKKPAGGDSQLPTLQALTQTNPDLSYTGVIRMRGLPYSATKEDIKYFFTGISIVPDGIHLVVGLDGRATGDSYVEFTSDEEANRAMARNRERIGSRYIELFRSNKGELYNYVAQRNGMGLAGRAGLGSEAVPPGGVYSENTCVRVRGLPYSASPQEIADFFTTVGATAITVHIMTNSQQRPTGEAYVEFFTPDEAQRAMSRHRQTLGHRYIEVFRATRTEMATQMAMARYTMPMDPTLLSLVQGPGMNAAALQQLDAVLGQMVPQQMPYGVSPQQQYQLQMQQQQALVGIPGVGPGAWPGVGRGGQVAAVGTTVRMRGLPYKASIADILDFFRGYAILPDTVRLGFDPDGRASGDAWLSFVTPEEAQRGVREKNRNTMHSRYVELFVVS
eukprot:CAMPEP_0184647442 /NCGR_PEP_ID=MMETSP0308-20130426/4378_1 /TAXON_ID=38269 /ORGANISM="Gloeochaete witrockiana, Strain SAG 46.84" /LENGTH=557 /DNA_ID=CAMNT_0027078411 /DNA_START=122 /DNA_END=1795 /DNA_ORIENTATION=-